MRKSWKRTFRNSKNMEIDKRYTLSSENTSLLIFKEELNDEERESPAGAGT